MSFGLYETGNTVAEKNVIPVKISDELRNVDAEADDVMKSGDQQRFLDFIDREHDNIGLFYDLVVQNCVHVPYLCELKWLCLFSFFICILVGTATISLVVLLDFWFLDMLISYFGVEFALYWFYVGVDIYGSEEHSMKHRQFVVGHTPRIIATVVGIKENHIFGMPVYQLEVTEQRFGESITYLSPVCIKPSSDVVGKKCTLYTGRFSRVIDGVEDLVCGKLTLRDGIVAFMLYVDSYNHYRMKYDNGVIFKL